MRTPRERLLYGCLRGFTAGGGTITDVIQPVVVSSVAARQHLAVLRDQTSSTVEFRRSAAAVSSVVLGAAADLVPWSSRTIDTGRGEVQVPYHVSQPVIVPVLRAGLAMLSAALEVLPAAPVQPVWVSRDEETLEATLHTKIVPPEPGSTIVVCDPMLATASSVIAVIDAFAACGAGRIVVASWIVAPEGVTRLESAPLPVMVATAAVDERLDGHGFIIPGLGDAGDRWCGEPRPY